MSQTQCQHAGSKQHPAVFLKSAAPGVITSTQQLHVAEVGLSVGRDVSVMTHALFPSYCFLVRLLACSIDDYTSSQSDLMREAEIEFWRDSRTFVHYGQLVCEMERLLFGRHFSLEDLRRGAEKKMGLPAGVLSPARAPTEEEEEQISFELQQQFAYIAETVGHVPDPAADKRFERRSTKGKGKAVPAKHHAINLSDSKVAMAATG